MILNYPRDRNIANFFARGRIGLNIPEASTVVMFDRWWNPSVEDQAVARADRFGRENVLHVIKFLCVNSVEERIEEIIKKKIYI